MGAGVGPRVSDRASGVEVTLPWSLPHLIFVMPHDATRTVARNNWAIIGLAPEV